MLGGLLAVAVVVSPAEAQEVKTWLFGDVSFPARVDTFHAVGAERWAEADRGTVLRYATTLAPGATVDVHVQPLPLGRADPEAVRREFQRGLRELATSGESGVRVAVDTVHSVSVEAGGWTYDGHVAAATLRGRGNTGRTLSYVFAKPPSFVKVRVTFEPVERAVLEPRIQPFLRELLGALESFQDGRSGGR